MGRNHQRYDKSGHQICYLPISFLSYSNQFLWSEMPSVRDPNCPSPSLALPGFIKSIWWFLQLHHASPFSAGLPLPTSSLTMPVSVSCHQQKIYPIILCATHPCLPSCSLKTDAQTMIIFHLFLMFGT